MEETASKLKKLEENKRGKLVLGSHTIRAELPTDVPIKAEDGHILMVKDELPSSVGSLFISKEAAEVPHWGVVFDSGDDIKKYVKGDHIAYHQYGETRIPFHGHEFIAIKESDVIARDTSSPEDED